MHSDSFKIEQATLLSTAHGNFQSHYNHIEDDRVFPFQFFLVFTRSMSFAQ